MNLHKLIFINNACYKAGKTITPKGIMVHSTGANNPNLKRYVGPDDGLLGKSPIVVGKKVLSLRKKPLGVRSAENLLISARAAVGASALIPAE